MQQLLSNISNAIELPFRKSSKMASFRALIKAIRFGRPSLVVMEGTGFAGGLACLVARVLWRTRYVVSSGDAVGPFISAHVPLAGPFAAIYERLLCRFSSGYIGWTPYLCGRALTYGASRAVTAPGWVLGGGTVRDGTASARLKREWGIPKGVIVVGILGSLQWNQHRQYCYGLELVKCANLLQRRDVAFSLLAKAPDSRSLGRKRGETSVCAFFCPERFHCRM